MSALAKRSCGILRINKDRYQQDEQRQARHILMHLVTTRAGAEAVANEVLTRVRSGESFESWRANTRGRCYCRERRRSGRIDATHNAGRTRRRSFLDARRRYSRAGQERLRFPHRSLDKILEPGPLPFEQVRASLLTEMQEQKAEGLFLELERNLSDALFDASDIQCIAAAVGVEVQTVDGFARDSAGAIRWRSRRVDAIFDATVLSGAQISEVIELDANRTAVFAVTGTTRRLASRLRMCASRLLPH